MRERSELQRLEPRLPFGAAQWIDVVFGDADTDVAIRHQLPPGRFREVQALVTRADRATQLYQGRSPEPGILYLRSSVADAIVTLLLVLPRDAHA